MNKKHHTPRPLRGIVFMLLAMSVVPFIDIAAKLIGHNLHIMEATLGRYVFHFIWLMPIYQAPLICAPFKVVVSGIDSFIASA